MHSYERIKVDRAAGQVSWSGAIADGSYSEKVGSFDEKNGAVEIVVTREAIDGGKSKPMRYRFSFAADALTTSKEVGPNAETLAFRNEYRFTR